MYTKYVLITYRLMYQKCVLSSLQLFLTMIEEDFHLRDMCAGYSDTLNE